MGYVEIFLGMFGKKDGLVKCSLLKLYFVVIMGVLFVFFFYRDVGYKSLCDKFDFYLVLIDKCMVLLKLNI